MAQFYRRCGSIISGIVAPPHRNIQYIHQNPIKAGMVKSAEQYKWSSHHSYLNEDAPFAGLLEKETVLGFFSADQNTAIKLYKEIYGPGRTRGVYRFSEEAEVMDEGEAQKYFERLLQERGLKRNNIKEHWAGEIIREYKAPACR